MKKMVRSLAGILATVMSLELGLMSGITAFAVSPGDVVINEIAWAGTADSSNDEWIELYNPTSQNIDLSGWWIEDDVDTVYAISAGVIAPHGYFLIEDSEATTDVLAEALIGLSLANTGDSLVLKDASGVTVDAVNGGGIAWYAGSATSKATMERIDPAVKIDSAENFASAISGNGSKGSLGTAILGTPGSVNSTFDGVGPELSFGTQTISAKLGDIITFPVNVAGVSDLYAYGLDIKYDPTLLDFVDAVEGGFLSAGGAGTAFNAALQDGDEGTLVTGNARLINPESGVDGGGELFSLTFKVVGTSDVATIISFGNESFLSDTVGGMPAKFGTMEVKTGNESVGAVSNLEVGLGEERYSLELSWTAPTGGADSYIVKRQMADGTFVTLGETAETFFIDNDSLDNGGKLVPNLNYNYLVITVKSGSVSAAVAINGTEIRGVRGDNDRSDRVDGKDIERLARSYGSTIGEEKYEVLKDTSFDGIVDGSDLIDIGANFAVTY